MKEVYQALAVCRHRTSLGVVTALHWPLPGGAQSLMGDKGLRCSWRCCVILDTEFGITEEHGNAEGDN